MERALWKGEKYQSVPKSGSRINSRIRESIFSQRETQDAFVKIPFVFIFQNFGSKSIGALSEDGKDHNGTSSSQGGDTNPAGYNKGNS